MSGATRRLSFLYAALFFAIGVDLLFFRCGASSVGVLLPIPVEASLRGDQAQPLAVAIGGRAAAPKIGMTSADLGL